MAKKTIQEAAIEAADLLITVVDKLGLQAEDGPGRGAFIQEYYKIFLFETLGPNLDMFGLGAFQPTATSAVPTLEDLMAIGDAKIEN